jgi:hypothetical protein
MKANEWHQRGTEATDPIEAFSNFWRAFNHLFFAASNGPEREKIIAFLRATIAEDKAAHLLESNADCVTYLLSEPIIDMRGNGRDTAPNAAAYSAATGALDELEQVILTIYQVRCNLEHGQKSPSRERDIQLCKCAAPIVAALAKRDA